MPRCYEHDTEGEQPGFVPDAWERFERVIKAVAKADPMPRPAAKPKKKKARKKAG